MTDTYNDTYTQNDLNNATPVCTQICATVIVVSGAVLAVSGMILCGYALRVANRTAQNGGCAFLNIGKDNPIQLCLNSKPTIPRNIINASTTNSQLHA